MAEIVEKTRAVFYSPSAGRHFLTKRGAAYREAAELVNAKYPLEFEERDEFGRIVFPGFHWSQDERLVRLQRRLTHMLMKKIWRES